MKDKDIIRFRLSNQQITSTKLTTPEEMVTWFGALQAQVYGMAKWALGLRLRGLTDTTIDNAFNEGRILRTHLLRPTWHFVAPQDIRWMLELTAPRVHGVNKYYYKKFELTAAVLKKANAILIKSLRDGRTLTRTVLNQALSRARIKADGLRLGYIFMQAELEGIICSGPREGKQFTYALLDERVPPSKPMAADEGLAELTKRYFTSRGPATLQDFVWWSGLTARQANKGAALLDGNFIRERIGDQEYILKAQSLKQNKRQMTFLMPDYDEYGISYKNKSSLLAKTEGIDLSKVSPYSHLLIVDGVISGTWTVEPAQSVSVEANPYFSMTRGQQQAIAAAIKRYKIFLEDRNRS